MGGFHTGVQDGSAAVMSEDASRAESAAKPHEQWRVARDEFEEQAKAEDRMVTRDMIRRPKSEGRSPASGGEPKPANANAITIDEKEAKPKGG